MADKQANMEEILTSIRTTLAEESAKVGTGDAGAEVTDEEVLALSEADVVEPSATPAPETNGEVIDLEAFGQGEVKMQAVTAVAADADVLGEGEEASTEVPVEAVPAVQAAPAAPSAAESAPANAEMAPGKDDLDKLIAEISSDAPAVVPAAPALAPKPASAPAAAPNGTVLPLAVTGEMGDLQVALPAEVLAAALRPLVRDWLKDNLPAVVERLVQAEIAKLSGEQS